MKTQTQKKNNDSNRNLMTDRRGLSTVEYVIILALIAIAAIGGWTAFGEALTNKISQEQAQIDGL